MDSELGAQFIDELGLHELIFVGNVETNNPFALQGFGKLPAQAVQMGLLHAENEVCPAEVPSGDNDPSARLCASGAHLIQRTAREELFGSQTAKLVLATDE